MRAVICGGVEYPTIAACAMDRETSLARVRYAVEFTGYLDGFAIRFANQPPAPDERPAVLHVVHCPGEPLLRAGYCRHRLGVHHGEPY